MSIQCIVSGSMVPVVNKCFNSTHSNRVQKSDPQGLWMHMRMCVGTLKARPLCSSSSAGITLYRLPKTGRCIRCSASDDGSCVGAKQPHNGQRKVQRALGVDYGRKHIGVAVSTLGLAPRPLQYIKGGGIMEITRMAQDVVALACDERCDAIIIGLPVTFEGSLYKRNTDSQQGRKCRNFADAVAVMSMKWSIDVFLVDERGTTQEAEALLDFAGAGKRSVNKGRADSVAAALILSTFFSKPEAALAVRIRRKKENL